MKRIAISLTLLALMGMGMGCSGSGKNNVALPSVGALSPAQNRGLITNTNLQPSAPVATLRPDQMDFSDISKNMCASECPEDGSGTSPQCGKCAMVCWLDGYPVSPYQTPGFAWAPGGNIYGLSGLASPARSPYRDPRQYNQFLPGFQNGGMMGYMNPALQRSLGMGWNRGMPSNNTMNCSQEETVSVLRNVRIISCVDRITGGHRRHTSGGDEGSGSGYYDLRGNGGTGDSGSGTYELRRNGGADDLDELDHHISRSGNKILKNRWNELKNGFWGITDALMGRVVGSVNLRAAQMREKEEFLNRNARELERIAEGYRYDMLHEGDCSVQEVGYITACCETDDGC